jgi:hypothetical protein
VNKKLIPRVLFLTCIAFADDVILLAVIIVFLEIELERAFTAEPDSLLLLIETSYVATVRFPHSTTGMLLGNFRLRGRAWHIDQRI